MTDATLLDRMAEAEKQILDSSLRVYQARAERVAMRCALGDAAALCDALAAQIGREHRYHGRIKKEGLALAAAVTRAADAIWAMREKIDVQERDGAARLASLTGAGNG